MLLKPVSMMKATDAAASGIGFVGGKTFDVADATAEQTVSLTDLSGGTASSPSENDIVFVVIATGGNFKRTNNVTFAGYTRVYASDNDIYSNATSDTSLTVWYKVMGASPDTSAVFTPSSASVDNSVVGIYVFSGVDTVTPLDVTPQQATSTADLNVNPPSITPVTSGAVVVAGGTYTIAGGAAPDALTSSGLSNTLSVEGFNGSYANAYHGGTIDWTSGAVDPAAFSTTETYTSGDSWCAFSFALRPA